MRAGVLLVANGTQPLVFEGQRRFTEVSGKEFKKLSCLEDGENVLVKGDAPHLGAPAPLWHNTFEHRRIWGQYILLVHVVQNCRPRLLHLYAVNKPAEKKIAVLGHLGV